MEQVKLLMTELSPELTRLCAETLAAQDIAVTVCEKDGAKALAALSAEKPDAVLLDAFMPGLDALTVKQRYDEAGGGKTVFFVTGSFTDDALESEMMKKGFSFYFQKPFDPEVLAARARTAAGRHAAAQPVVDDECTVTEILFFTAAATSAIRCNSCIVQPSRQAAIWFFSSWVEWFKLSHKRSLEVTLRAFAIATSVSILVFILPRSIWERLVAVMSASSANFSCDSFCDFRVWAIRSPRRL